MASIVSGGSSMRLFANGALKIGDCSDVAFSNLCVYRSRAASPPLRTSSMMGLTMPMMVSVERYDGRWSTSLIVSGVTSAAIYLVIRILSFTKPASSPFVFGTDAASFNI